MSIGLGFSGGGGRVKLDSNGNVVGFYNSDGTVAPYYQATTAWQAGQVASVVTPSITADGDLTTSTDQVPLLWRFVINAADDVSAAQALLDGTPNVITMNPGDVKIMNTDTDIVNVYAICVSTAGSRPTDFAGGAYIMSGTGSTLADVLSNMAMFDFSAATGADYLLVSSSQVYTTNYMQLHVQAGVVS